MKASVQGSAEATRVSDMERRNMSIAEGEQCALDDFWGLVANQVEQAESTAAMEREDRRSEHVRARLKREERYSLWEEEDLRKRGTRSIMREKLEDAARREYLEIFYGAPSADMAIHYAWPTRALLSQAAGQQSSASLASDPEESITVSLSGGSGGTIGRDDARSRLSTAQISQDIYNDWSSGGTAASTGGESSSTRPFHIFRGKKTHQMLPVRDCFVPPRHLSEPTTKKGLISVHALADAACHAGKETSAGPPKLPDVVGADAPCGLSKASHLPPMMTGTSRENCSAGSAAGWTAPAGSTGSSFSRNKRPLSWQQSPPVSSFDRKLAARREQWAREAEAEAGERALQEQARAQELLRNSRGVDGARDHGGGTGHYCNNIGNIDFSPQFPPAAGFSHSQENRVTRDQRRRSRSRSGPVGTAFREDDGRKVMELIPEREEELLTQMFGILDARGRGEVRLDEVLFYMTENAQVKSVLQQVTLWPLTKTRRWKWVEELLAAQPGRTLTLPALLAFSRGLHEESGVPRKHLRLAREPRRIDEDRKDARSKRLLPVDFVGGAEVEALFRKGFEWYRAWIVRCNVDDTFDVRYTRALPASDTSRGREEDAAGEQRPEVETSTQTSGSEEDWGRSDEETSAAEAEEEWKATCDNVARFIGIPPDLGQTETELLEKAYDAIATLTSRLRPGPAPIAHENCVAHGKTQGKNSDSIASSNACILGESSTISNNREGGQQKLREMQPQKGETRPGTPNRGRNNNVNGVVDVEACSPLRIPAEEIVRVLRAGAIDDLRRASPALSAACIHREFAEGLAGAATITGVVGSSTGSDHRILFGRSDGCAGTEGGRRRHGSGDDGRVLGVSKEEFCDYFEAVTDLVDLNGLNLVPRAHPGLVRPSAVGA